MSKTTNKFSHARSVRVPYEFVMRWPSRGNVHSANTRGIGT